MMGDHDGKWRPILGSLDDHSLDPDEQLAIARPLRAIHAASARLISVDAHARLLSDAIFFPAGSGAAAELVSQQ